MATPAIERFTVKSGGNVGISVMKTGSGPALLLIHGALLNATLSWGAVLAKLAAHFTVYAMDRRGRAPSGDSESYSISMEAGDIAHVVDAIGEAIGQPVTILAHSYGALATLEALEQLKGIKRLILYEPPLYAGATRAGVRRDHAANGSGVAGERSRKNCYRISLRTDWSAAGTPGWVSVVADLGFGAPDCLDPAAGDPLR